MNVWDVEKKVKDKQVAENKSAVVQMATGTHIYLALFVRATDAQSSRKKNSLFAMYSMCTKWNHLGNSDWIPIS